jgi:hypothetical protein
MDAIHLNSYSTAPSLKNKNLIRYIASDNNLQDIITKEISLQSGNVVIIKSTINNIYSDDYIDVIKKAVPKKKIFIINENEFELNKIFNNNVGNNITIYFIIENPIQYYRQIFNFNPKTNFSIISGDIVNRDLTNDINLLNYLNNKNTRVIYQLISEKEIELSKLYNKFINNSKTPATSLLYNTLVILDIALLMTDTINIIDRDYYTDISLNEFNDHSKIVYGIFNYDFNSFKLNKLYNIVNNILY